MADENITTTEDEVVESENPTEDTPTNMENTDDTINAVTDEEPTDEVYEHKMKILRNAYQKLDNLPLGFGIPAYDDEIPDATIEKYFKTDYSDTLRETGLNIEDIEDDSKDEMFFENRICYHAIKRYRLSSSIFFKFSTAVDGKTVDKTKIPQMLKEILAEYEEEYKSWRLGHTGKIWQRTATLNMNGSDS